RPAEVVDRPLVVLLVDRDDDTLEMYTEFLRRAGWDVDEARDGREALAKAIATRPDAIVTATRLSGISGLDLCRILNRDPTTAAIPVLFVTGNAGEVDLGRALAAGASRVLVKPCLPDRLMCEIQALLVNGHRLLDEPPPRSETVNDHDASPITTAGKSERHVMLNHVYHRQTTKEPAISPPALVCPSCYQPLLYVNSYIGGVSARHPEQWDYFKCETGCGTFQYRHRTRKVRQIS